MIKTLKISQKEYPGYLKEIYQPPQKLFYKGEISSLKNTCISIVGTRKCTEYGEYVTKKIVEELSTLEVTIISGLASGIDTVAHRAALYNNMPTIAVLGSGLNCIYPQKNLALAEEIQKKGLLISEYENDRTPIKYQFPQRNRIISGMSVATIVIEAAEKSGALITAKFAIDQGRELFVVPGDIDRERSLGPLRLLQNSGAYPISSGYDVIEILKTQPHLFPPPENETIVKGKQNLSLPYNLTIQEKKVIQSLSSSRGKSPDEISNELHYSIEDTLTTLSLLEIQGLITPKNGRYLKRF